MIQGKMRFENINTEILSVVLARISLYATILNLEHGISFASTTNCVCVSKFFFVNNKPVLTCKVSYASVLLVFILQDNFYTSKGLCVNRVK